MSASEQPDSDDLNAWRDRYADAMRALIAQVRGLLPTDLKGILGRAGDVLELQLPALERLCALDLSAGAAGEGPEERREKAEVLLRAQHLPRMVLAFGQVLLQEERSLALRPVEEQALLQARELALLTQAWVQRNQEALGLDLDFEEEGELPEDLIF